MKGYPVLFFHVIDNRYPMKWVKADKSLLERRFIMNTVTIPSPALTCTVYHYYNKHFTAIKNK